MFIFVGLLEKADDKTINYSISNYQLPIPTIDTFEKVSNALT